MPFPRDLTDIPFGRLVVLGRDTSRVSSKEAFWRCHCLCGNDVTVSGGNLRKGSEGRKGGTRSCGCLRREIRRLLAKGRPPLHGAARKGHATPEYRTWQKIKERCYVPACKSYPDYGGRGITMCDRWRTSFPAFLEDMGLRPSTLHTIERRDNSAGYTPDNCCWATRREQNRNKRSNTVLTWNDQTHCLSRWSEIVHIPERVLSDRHRANWSTERILTTPVRRWPSQIYTS